ncbi:MAG: hypothetical protein EOP48_26215 [Sphingobacteriales bacterium]|nr:MAG: hypothetical protein EOP48_26215 [Sphingobacteriales bacterium]
MPPHRKALKSHLPFHNHSAMGLFDLFKKPLIVNDDFFGALRFVDVKDPSKDYFEGNGHFTPTGNETEYLIQADKNGPTDEQKQFYRDLQLNFNQFNVSARASTVALIAKIKLSSLI